MAFYRGYTISDAHEWADGTNFSESSSLLQMNGGGGGGVQRRAGMLFLPPIPQGAVIVTAKIRIYAGSTTTDDAAHDIYCEDVDSADDFVTTADVVSRAVTTASVRWDESSISADGQFNFTPELKTIAQEVVDRVGFSQRLMFLFYADASSTPTLTCTSEDGASPVTRTPTLEIQWEGSGRNFLGVSL